MRRTCPHCQQSVELAELASSGSTVCPSCGSSFQAEPDLLSTVTIGQQLGALGRFNLRSELGAGAFGTVYEAFDSQLDRIVAVKVPREGVTSSNVQQRFLREARSAAQLRHPGIVPIYEVGQTGELVFLVSEFVSGVNLADYMTGHSLSVRQAAAITASLADALHYAHSQGIVHRDVKPSNVMLALRRPKWANNFGKKASS